jgi:hypothetical protein
MTGTWFSHHVPRVLSTVLGLSRTASIISFRTDNDIRAVDDHFIQVKVLQEMLAEIGRRLDFVPVQAERLATTIVKFFID